MFILIQAPGWAFYMLWTNILAPWIFAEPGGQEEMDPKQQKKLERKMKKEKIVYRQSIIKRKLSFVTMSIYLVNRTLFRAFYPVMVALPLEL